MRIYTRTGDSGETGLFGGLRVRKDDSRIETCGTVDEINASLGVALTMASGELANDIRQLQHRLFDLGADLATPLNDSGVHGNSSIRRVTMEDVERLEVMIDRWEAQLPPLTRFILPGGSSCSAALHVSRAVCRRAERRMAAAPVGMFQPNALPYLNRVADLLFVMARAANLVSGRDDVAWEQLKTDG